VTLSQWERGDPPRRVGEGEKIALLKNLTLHMIGDSPGSDRTLLDNLLSLTRQTGGLCDPILEPDSNL